MDDHGRTVEGELWALPRTRAELAEAEKRARARVTRRALIASATVLVPIPGFDLAADIGTLMKLIPEINREFGLTPEQIARLNARQRALLYNAIVIAGSTLAGKVLTRDLVFAALHRVGLQITLKQVTKYVPMAGQAVSAVIAYAALQFVCRQHIRDCVRIVERLENQVLLAHAA